MRGSSAPSAPTPNIDRENLSWDDVSTRVIEWMRIDVERVQLVLDLPRAPSRRRSVPSRSRVPARRRGAHPQSGGWAGDEHGHRRRREPRVEARGRSAGRADASLLDSYEPERIAFARRLVATTDRAFTGVTSGGAIARFVRLNVVPARDSRDFQIRGYATGDVSDRLADGDSTTAEHPQRRTRGRRARRRPVAVGEPDATGADNFAPLTSLDWQVHVYGDAPRAIHAACRERSLPLHVFPWTVGCGRAGFRRDAVYLVTTRRLCWSRGSGSGA